MTFDEKIKQVLDMNIDQYPEVTSIEIGYDHSDDHDYIILISMDDEKYSNLGKCTIKAVEQTAMITIIHPIGKQENKDAAKNAAQTADKVIDVLSRNITLDSFLISGEIIENVAGEDFQNSAVKFNTIRFKGKYWKV